MTSWRRRPDLVPLIKQAYGQADAAWRLPIHGGFESFATIIDVPFVARHARHERHHTRAAFGVPLDRPLALVSFGGYGVTGLDLRSLDCLQRWTILLTGRQPVDDLPPGIHVIDDDWIYERGFRYEDLVRAVGRRHDQARLRHRVRMPGERRGNCSIRPADGLRSTRSWSPRCLEFWAAPRSRTTICLPAGGSRLSNGQLGAPAPTSRPATDGADVIADMIVGTLDGR